MSKFCTNCGAEMEDDSLFCTNCGEKFAPAEEAVAAFVEAPVVEAAPAKKDFKAIFAELKARPDFKTLVVAAAALLVVIVLAIVLLCGTSYKDAVKNYQAVMNGNAGKIAAMAPNDYWKYVKEEEDITKADVKDTFKDLYDEMKDEMEDEFGKNAKYSIKVTEADKLSKKKLKALAENIEDHYEIDEKKVKAGYELECEISIKGRLDDDEYEDTLYAVKIGGNWYVVSASGTFFVDIFVAAAINE